eukprot:850779-Amphidinium_carterae.2
MRWHDRASTARLACDPCAFVILPSSTWGNSNWPCVGQWGQPVDACVGDVLHSLLNQWWQLEHTSSTPARTSSNILSCAQWTHPSGTWYAGHVCVCPLRGLLEDALSVTQQLFADPLRGLEDEVHGHATILAFV